MSEPKNKRGRPAKLSKEIIIGCALDLLKQGSDKVSMNAIAKTLDCAPMSLYTYFGNRQELLNALSAEVLSELTIEVSQEENWQHNIRIWMHALHEHFSGHPSLLNLINEERNELHAEFFIPWLRVYTPLISNLIKAGFSGVTLVQHSRWLTQAVLGDILLNGARDEPIDRVNLVKHVLNESDPEEKAAFEILEKYSNEVDTNLFSFVVEQIVIHLESQSS